MALLKETHFVLTKTQFDLDELQWLQDLGVTIECHQESVPVNVYGRTSMMAGVRHITLITKTQEQETLVLLKYGGDQGGQITHQFWTIPLQQY